MESLCAVKLKRSDKAFINAYADLLTNGCSDKIYVSDICKKAGYTTMCFYQNYEDKNAFGKFIVDYETDLYIECIKRMNDLILCGEATPENFIVSGCDYSSLLLTLYFQRPFNKLHRKVYCQKSCRRHRGVHSL